MQSWQIQVRASHLEMIRVYCGWRFEHCRKVRNNSHNSFRGALEDPRLHFFDSSLSLRVLRGTIMIRRLEGNLPSPHRKRGRWFNWALKSNNLISHPNHLLLFSTSFFSENLTSPLCLDGHALKRICNIDCVGAQMVAICVAISDWLTRRCWLWGISVGFRWTHPHWCPDYG